ncbi:hypothetical protein A4E84_29780 [Streptomyces qaidamensis]|uniref:Uncharacterized protein n=1 Tax=Streptomyces qaidamensis TaxID=1783515 RepID=A0A143C7E6_9ACTN|nr:hypothetical protein [Streptomyces qaidamensis]AMW13318.1 hypothetical protein A4E84_29780 [Streptomyces qaidamensis]
MAYATEQQLIDYLAPDPTPANAAKVLDRASDDIDGLLIGAVYNTDVNGMPTDPKVQTALRMATLAQAEYLVATGDLTCAQRQGGRVQVGGVEYTRGTSGTEPGRIAPAALQALRVSGALNRWVVTW